MANFAYTENNEIVEVFDELPRNWGRYSNFHVLENDEAFLNSIGWYILEKITPNFDPTTHKLGAYKYVLEDGTAYETRDLVRLPPKPIVIEKTAEELAEEREAQRLTAIADKWAEVRATRDELMRNNDWRYTRYEREVRLEISPTTDDITVLDTYMQALANITDQEDPFNITWPEPV